MSQEAWEQSMQRIVMRCWTDAEFKASLQADPVAALQSLGIEVPGGLQLQVLVDTEEVRHLVIPALPVDLSDAQLDALAGGRGLTPEIVDAIAQGNVKRVGDPAAQLPNLIYGARLPWLR